MNLTLAQLAHKAGITVNAECKKFAELIVRKCADIAGRYGTPDGYYIAAEINRIMLNIRTDKGFGVEE